ncbi:TPA: hypothetical protein ACLHMH_000503 [Acinetobacter baumannii]
MRKIQLCCSMAGWTGQLWLAVSFVAVFPTLVQSVTITVGSSGVRFKT